MNRRLTIILFFTLLFFSACNKCVVSDYSGKYTAESTFYDVNKQKYVKSEFNGIRIKHVLYLKSDSTFSYKFLRHVWGNGNWHDNGSEIILDFMPQKEKGFNSNYWYENATMILTKNGCDKLRWTLSTFKKIELKNE